MSTVADVIMQVTRDIENWIIPMSSRDGAMNAPIFVGNGSKVKDSLWMMSQPSATARLRLNHNEETDPSLGTCN
ncbi:hypothetical protein Gohar_015464 [Gossypium harknessii]|uniref:Uncharacterized protein n=1 Tax=Gossypium harknessii TaxID=34285 RepID=A0A7J9FZS8_9ROSI|nr:hypothetical protein [Gossypium harknessii]